MRAGFGLVGLLVTIGVIVWLMHSIILPYNQTVLQKGKTAREQAEQLGGHDPTGVNALDAFTSTQVNDGAGRFKGIQVTSIDPTMALPTYYGLQLNDVIVQVDGLDFATVNMDEEESARNWVLQGGYEKQREITVIRNEQRVTLPQAGTSPVSPAVPFNIVQQIPTH